MLTSISNSFIICLCLKILTGQLKIISFFYKISVFISLNGIIKNTHLHKYIRWLMLMLEEGGGGRGVLNFY